VRSGSRPKGPSPAGDRAHASRLLSERFAFAVIRGLSALTILVLGLIVGFVLLRGLRFSNETRSAVLPYAEAWPDGLVVVTNPSNRPPALDFPVLYDLFTDGYLNWSKIDAEEDEVRAFAMEAATPEGARSAALLFGSAEAAAWGGSVEFLPTASMVLAKVAATPGAVAIVPAAAFNGYPGINNVPLRRLCLVANAEALALVDDHEVEDLSDADIAALLAGKTANWSLLGGPDLAVRLLAPPEGGDLAAAARAAGFDLAAGRPSGGGGGRAATAAYLAELASTPGALGLAFAGDARAAGLEPLTRKGLARGWNLSFRYLVEPPRLSGRVGGISTIIVNTFWMLLLTLLMAAPMGVAAAVYLVEYARQGRFVSLLRLGTETLAGIPSIIFGLFGMLFFVNILHFGFGLLSGCLTLTLMILPTIVRTSEEALKSVPRALREGSLALGATRLQTISRVVVPAALPGILTGLILGIGRAVGETAALLFTMGSDYKAVFGLFSSARVLSAHVYLLFAEGISFDRAFSTATVLIVVVLVFNFAAKRLVARLGRNAAA
jgi:phosphate transport system permease protein